METPEAGSAFTGRPAPKESVDNWPSAIVILDALGGTPVHRYPPHGVTGDGEPPLEVDMFQFDGPSRVPVASGTDPTLRNSVVAIGW